MKGGSRDTFAFLSTSRGFVMKRTICILISALMILSSFTFLANAADPARTGRAFALDELYRTAERLDKQPHTYEAWVKVEKGAPASALGVIAGNYKNGTDHSYGFEVRENGNPFLWVGYGKDGTSQRLSFDKVDLRTGEWTHVVITHDEKTAYCYIDGELMQTLTASLPAVDMSKTGSLCIGGDLRSGNSRWLKNTEISSVALYSDMRSADEIKVDMQKTDPSDADLLVCYDLSGQNINDLKDLSANGRDLTYTGKMYESVKTEEDTEKGGIAFTADPYALAKSFDKAIKTFEATVYFPKNFVSTERGGVIIGNYNSNIDCVNFEIYSDGSPRVYIHKSGTTYNFVFDKANVYTGEWVHIAVVRETSSKMSCYINGELVQSITKSAPDLVNTDAHVLGGDLRSGNAQYFKGRIKNVALYDDARTADEIKADMTAAGKDGLICSYELDGLSAPTSVSDKSGNGYDAKLKMSYFTEKAPLEEYAYSFAVVGDTQILAESYPEKYTALYDWILGNVESKKIKFVLGLGDITNSSTAAEWELAKQNIHRMDGVVPYSLVRGNHDTESTMMKYFPIADYKEKLGGVYNSKNIFNSWQELIVGEIKYLIFTLDYGAQDAVLNWASEIIAAHPEHNVIITTHAYLFRDGTTLDAGDVVPPSNKGAQYNNGDHIWDKLIKKHENIVLVLSGHDPCDTVVYAQDKGANGNVVTQFLIDPQGVDKAQGGVGLVTMFYFSADGKTMQVETYSTDKKAYFLEENQFTVTLDLVGDKQEETTAPETTAEATEAHETEQIVTEAAVTEAPTTTEPEKSGCGASVSIAAIPMIFLAVSAVFKKRREE